ncbi:hypothetical protein CERSUDRAFT_83108 [Gelatoporia subvermispora B]|uniref:Uncharacterized protein n=1 Tax=Ceriporiopsis subvermispora (strain B) TaxID=914234 RepID=M2QJX8_CERS8|nr:hypothetical protein CERSUDRAFT_83108 [Gelatoporia subvermispora B]
MSATLQPRITVNTTYVPPTEPSLPALAVRTTQLVDSYMLWIGTADVPPEEVNNAPSQGCLSKDWACAMPARDVSAHRHREAFEEQNPWPCALYRTPSSDAALSMAQRLARRFKKQIFLSIDVPPSIQTLGEAPKLLLAVERAALTALKDAEGRAS